MIGKIDLTPGPGLAQDTRRFARQNRFRCVRQGRRRAGRCRSDRNRALTAILEAPIFEETSIIPPRSSHPCGLSIVNHAPRDGVGPFSSKCDWLGVIAPSWSANRGEQPLHRRARLEGVPAPRCRAGAHRCLRRRPRILASAHLAAEWIEHHGRTAPRTAAANFRGQIVLSQRLNPRVERQHQARAGFGRLEREAGCRKSDGRARPLVETQHHRLAADQPIVLQTRGRRAPGHPSLPTPTTGAARVLSG